MVCAQGVCQAPVCGDGVVHPELLEECDDGNQLDDRCGTACKIQVVTKIGAAGVHTCARLNDWRLKCWGRNDFGQLGLGGTNSHGVSPGEMGDSLPAVNLGADKTPTAIAGGVQHTCALLNGGSVKCWGLNNAGQLGLGDINSHGDGPREMGDSLPAVNLGAGKTALAIAAGSNHTCALLNGGSIKCWGLNTAGQLGLGNTGSVGDGPGEMGDSLPGVDLGTGKTALAITCGYSHTCVLLNDGSVKCWGGNLTGELGLGNTSPRGDDPGEMGDSLPSVNLGTAKTALEVASSGYHTCALLSDGSVKCWGRNSRGQLGLGNTDNRGDGPGEMGDSLPTVNLGASKTAVAIAGGYEHTCALLSDGSVKCWGWNYEGQLGLGDTNNRGDGPGEMGGNLAAVNLGTGKTATAIASGYSHNCVLLNDGSVKCWGANSSGRLGLGDQDNRGDEPGEMGDALPNVKLFSDVW
ncbi:RCC1 domain-containing protein [Polyangium sorediatum]|uniref:Uncharacterized protein n=1 Tax=Polyangium sorediatum TaxID=889274 RepID=A0ABT6NNC7_9BACT|nr:hypothetical protein [Polyangium sorediatum]MDI1429695.1 hypothetical protein [Polyangium sorediatum]